MPDMTAAAAPIKLGGKEYLLSPLTDGDVEELNNWIRSSVIQMAHASLVPGMEKEVRDEILGAAIREARKMALYNKEGQDFMRDANGVARLLWQGLKKKHPDLTHAFVREQIMTTRVDVSAAMEMFNEINSGSSSTGGSTQDGSPKV